MISLVQLNRACYKVQTELSKLNFYNEKIAAVDIHLVPFSRAYGYKYNGKLGSIGIPRVSLSRFRELFPWYSRTSLADVLRHEYGHAVADEFKKHIRTREYTAAFNSPYSSNTEYEFDANLFVSTYAARSSAEDFAETFMYYVKHMGKIPERFKTPAIRAKWSFISQLRKTLKLTNSKGVQ